MKQAVRRELSPSQTSIKRERSPLPPTKSAQPSTAKTQPTSRDSAEPLKLKKERRHQIDNTSKTHRRKSPIYTSSEDESVKPLMRNLPEQSTDFVSNTSQRSSSVRMRPSAPLPTDHSILRERYSTVYLDYIAVFQKVVAQKKKIERRLKGRSGSSASEEDLDMMSTEELERLSAEHKRLQDELESIKDAWSR